jgi:splicing factor 3B subunit 2
MINGKHHNNSDINQLLDEHTKSNTNKRNEEYQRKLKDKKHQRKKDKRKQKENLDNVRLDQLNQGGGNLEDLLRDENIEMEYIEEKEENKFFEGVFDKFIAPVKQERKDSDDEEEEEDLNDLDGVAMGEEVKVKEKQGAAQLSKKKRKQLSRMKISELKALTKHPELVEPWDVTAQDPVLLLYLKTLGNTIPVPKHWSQKRKFLQNKRGIVKPPLQLPEFIEKTGISKIRDTTVGDKRVLKLKVMDRMNPKMGKMDIDYQVLYDAFFKHQTKPGTLTKHGDTYYENKEYETKMRIYKPGRISEKLRVALGIPENSPPPWIINMQRYGPPTCYPNLKIPGVNAPMLDPTADITPNLWTPPVSEDKPVPVFNYLARKDEPEHWGDIRELDEDDYSEIDDDLSISELNGEEKYEVEGIFNNMDIDQDNMPMQRAIGDIDMTGAVPNPNANIIPARIGKEDFFTVLEEKKVSIKEGEIFGSTTGYVIPPKQGETIVKEEEKKEEPVPEKPTEPAAKKKDASKYKIKF